MSIYDHRDKSAYGNFTVDAHYGENQHILKWWSTEHDELLMEQIKKNQWVWYWGITEKIVAITPHKIIEAWKKDDPLCSKYAWYNILMYFAASRAEKLGLTKFIRKPQWKICPLCCNRFVEDSLPVPFIERLGISHLDFCAPCLRDTTLQNSGSETLSKKEVLTYLKELADLLKSVPSQDFGEGVHDFDDLNVQERVAVLKILKVKPTQHLVKKLFGSWLKALIDAKVLEDGTRRMSRGTQCLARDGHVCLSLGEKTIDDLLHVLKIPHEKEPRYPEGNFRGDFFVNGVFIEYFGLVGNEKYDAKIKLKQELCKKHGIRLISIYPRDLVSSKKLETIFLAAHLAPTS